MQTSECYTLEVHKVTMTSLFTWTVSGEQKGLLATASVLWSKYKVFASKPDDRHLEWKQYHGVLQSSAGRSLAKKSYNSVVSISLNGPCYEPSCKRTVMATD